MVSSGLLVVDCALIRSRTFLAATGSDSTNCEAPSLSDHAVLARLDTMAMSNTPAPNQRGMCQRFMASTAGRSAVVSSKLSMMGMNTALAQCKSARLANRASKARERLRTSTGMWSMSGLCGGGAVAAIAACMDSGGGRGLPRAGCGAMSVALAGSAFAAAVSAAEGGVGVEGAVMGGLWGRTLGAVCRRLSLLIGAVVEVPRKTGVIHAMAFWAAPYDGAMQFDGITT